MAELEKSAKGGKCKSSLISKLFIYMALSSKSKEPRLSTEQ